MSGKSGQGGWGGGEKEKWSYQRNFLEAFLLEIDFEGSHSKRWEGYSRKREWQDESFGCKNIRDMEIWTELETLMCIENDYKKNI